MGLDKPQRWVTAAENDTEAWKCLVIVRALRRILTTRPLIAILGNHVTREMR